MSYEVYKAIHLISLIIITATLSLSFLYDGPKKATRIIGMIASFTLFVAGFGLLARTQVGFQPWVIAKIVIWTIVGVGGPILAKRAKENRGKYLVSLVALLAIAVILAVYKVG